MPTPAELLAEVLSEHAAYEAYDSEMSPNPYHPRTIAEKLATPDAVPFLVEARERGDNVEVRYVAYALEKLGSTGRGASAALEKLGEHLALFAVDEPRARELGLHRSSDRSLRRFDARGDRDLRDQHRCPRAHRRTLCRVTRRR